MVLNPIIYPNPSDNEVIIECNKQFLQPSDVKLKLYNSLGVEIPFNRKDINIKGSTITLNVSGLSSGIYLFEISDANNHFYKGKIVKE